MRTTAGVLVFAVVAAVVAAGCGDGDGGGADGAGDSAPTASADAAGLDVTDTSVETFTTESGVKIDYVLVVPEGRDEGAPGKVLVAFPPGGQDLDLTRRIVDGRYRDEALARGWVVVSPAAPSTGLYFTDESAALVPELLDEIARRFPPDEGRFDLMGVNNGGLSAFRAALDQPARFRSLVVYPGYSRQGGDDPALADLAGLGVAMFVGGDDDAWLGASEQTKQTLDGFGITAELSVVEGEGHVIESLTGADLFDALERVRT